MVMHVFGTRVISLISNQSLVTSLEADEVSENAAVASHHHTHCCSRSLNLQQLAMFDTTHTGKHTHTHTHTLTDKFQQVHKLK
jgi:hypothetical protein